MADKYVRAKTAVTVPRTDGRHDALVPGQVVPLDSLDKSFVERLEDGDTWLENLVETVGKKELEEWETAYADSLPQPNLPVGVGDGGERAPTSVSEAAEHDGEAYAKHGTDEETKGEAEYGKPRDQVREEREQAHEALGEKIEAERKAARSSKRSSGGSGESKSEEKKSE